MGILKIVTLLAVIISSSYEKYNFMDKQTVVQDNNFEKINIYLFWGDGCPHCEKMISFFEDIEDEYGKYYNLVKYEIWHDTENKELMKEVSNLLGDDVKGVPYLIVGDTSINGYNSSKDEYIKQTILKQRNSKFDVIKKLEDLY